MLILSVLIRVPPGEVEALSPHMRKAIQGSRAEPGCIFYSLAEDVAEPGVIRAFEIYKDDDALRAHGASEHFKVWREASGQYPREERRLYDATPRS
jgi:quinol monooxygenase YgiN